MSDEPKTEHEVTMDAIREIGETGGTDMSVFLGQLIQANYNSYAATTQQLLDNYREDIERLTAELATIRELVSDALSGKYMPTQRHLLSCLYPTDAQIAQRGDGGGWR